MAYLVSAFVFPDPLDVRLFFAGVLDVVLFAGVLDVVLFAAVLDAVFFAGVFDAGHHLPGSLCVHHLPLRPYLTSTRLREYTCGSNYPIPTIVYVYRLHGPPFFIFVIPYSENVRCSSLGVRQTSNALFGKTVNSGSISKSRLSPGRGPEFFPHADTYTSEMDREARPAIYFTRSTPVSG